MTFELISAEGACVHPIEGGAGTLVLNIIQLQWIQCIMLQHIERKRGKESISTQT